MLSMLADRCVIHLRNYFPSANKFPFNNILPENKSQRGSQIDGDKVHAGITFEELQPSANLRTQTH